MTIDATKVGQVVEKPAPEIQPRANTETEILVLNSGVAVRNAVLLPEKALAIMDYYYRHVDKNSCVAMIIPRSDGRPAGVCGMAFSQVFTYSVNLEMIMNKAIAKVRNGKSFMDIRTTAWYGLLHTMIHESIHITENGGNPPEDLDADGERELEALINEVVQDKIVELAKEIDIEPPAVGDMGFMGAKLMQLFISDQDDEAVKKTQMMIDKGLVYLDETEEGKTIFHKTLRDYVRVALADKDDADWEGTPAVVNLVYQLENGEVGEVAGEEPVEAVKLEPNPEIMKAMAEVGEQVAAIKAAEIPNVVVAAPTAAPMFGAVADGSEDMAGNPEAEVLAEILDQDEDAVDTAPAGVLPMSQQAPVFQPTPTASDVAGGHVAAPGMFPVPTQIAANIQNAQSQEQPTQAGPTYAGWTTPSLSPENLKACLYEIYGLLFHAMFTKGGWSQNPATGRFHFAQPGKLLASISVDHILKKYNAEGLIAEYEAMDPGTGKKVVEKCASGAVRGGCYSDGNKAAVGWLPVFVLHLNIGGERVIRKLIPQNPEKRDSNNAYKKSANEAATGFAKAYVFSNAPDTATWAQRCPLKLFYDYGTNQIRFEEQK